MEKRVKLIFKELICGGIGIAPALYKYQKKYYTVRGDVSQNPAREKLNSLAVKRSSSKGHTLWKKHRNDRLVTPDELLSIVGVK